MMDGYSFSRASSNAPCRTVVDILGWPASMLLYGRADNAPPVDHNPDGDSWNPGGAVSVILIETAEGDAAG